MKLPKKLGDRMAKKSINKIIYFDKETIRNILQERDHGELSRKTDVSHSVQSQGSVAAEVSAEFLFCSPERLKHLM